MLEQVRQAGDLGNKPLVLVLGSQGDGGNEQLRDLFDQQAALSTNANKLVVEGATHAELVDQENHAAQTSAGILAVVESVRTGEPLVERELP